MDAMISDFNNSKSILKNAYTIKDSKSPMRYNSSSDQSN